MKKNLLNALIFFAILCIALFACKPQESLLEGATVKSVFKIVNCVDDTCKLGWYPNVQSQLWQLTPQVNTTTQDTVWLPEVLINEIAAKVDQEFRFENVPLGNHYAIRINNAQTIMVYLSKEFKVIEPSEINVGIIGF